jgi:hypothetical protein
VLVNARVATKPETLRSWIEGAIEQAGETTGCHLTTASVEAFSPARPIPLYRFAASASMPG